MSKDRRLGRGLAALLGSSYEDDAPVSQHEPRDRANEANAAVPAPHFNVIRTEEPGDMLLRLDVHEIDDNPYQPRRDFSEPEIASLAESLKEHDMLQPILVRRVSGRYQLISGERRLRAAILAGWKKVPVRLREADDRLVAELAIVENLQRKDLNPIEKALSFKRYLDEHECTQDELAHRLKLDRSSISNLMRLLELPQTVLDGIRDGSLTAGHARALLPLGEEKLQISLADRIRSEGMSVREIERLVQEEIARDDGPRNAAAAKSSKVRKVKRNEQTSQLETELRRALGVKVEIAARGEKGKLVIHFNGHEEFERIREALIG